MNVAILTWPVVDLASLPDTPVFVHYLKDWSRVHAAFSKSPDFQNELQLSVIERLWQIKTFADYARVKATSTPYTPFEFTDERPALLGAEELLSEMAAYFLQEPT